MAQDKLKPFRPNTLLKARKAGVIAFTDGGSGVNLNLPAVGYLSAIVCRLTGTLNLGGAGALADLGPFNLLKTIEVFANFGGASIWKTSGFGAFIASNGFFPNFLPDAGDSRSLTANSDVYSAPVANGNNTWTLFYVLPIALNFGINFDAGLILLQSNTVTVTIAPSFGNAAGDAVASLIGGTGFSGNLHCYYLYFEVPPRDVAQPPLLIVRTLEEVAPIVAQGENIYRVPPMGTLLQLTSVIRLNSVRSDGFDYSRILYNKTETRFDMERQFLRFMNRAQGGMNLPVGCYRWDFWAAYCNGVMSVGDSRDAIDTEEIAQLEVVYNITGALGGSGNEIRYIRRIVQILQ